MQIAQSPIQPDPEYFQGWGIHNISEQPVLVSHHPHIKKFLPYVQYNLLFIFLCSFEKFLSYLSNSYQVSFLSFLQTVFLHIYP